MAATNNIYLIIPKKETRDIFWFAEKYIFSEKNKNSKNIIIVVLSKRINLIFFLKRFVKKSKIIIKQLILIAAFPTIIDKGNKRIPQSKK